MPALTLSQIEPILGTYIEPSGDFKSSMNQVLARIVNMGTYRDLTVQYSLPVMNGCVTLPDDADAILHVMVNGFPAPVRAMWHDYRSIGTGSLASAELAWGLIDAGFQPTKILVPEATSALHVVPSDHSPTRNGFAPDDGEAILVTATDTEKVYASSVSTVAEFDTTLAFDEPISNVMSIRFDGLNDTFDIRLSALDPDTTIATVGPDSGITRYRRFRLNQSVDNGTIVHVLCKRAFQPLTRDSDIVYIGNMNAIKQGLLARIAEDGADIERAEYHWNKCFQLLEEEAASTRGAAIPRLSVDPYGTNNLDIIRSTY